MGSEAQRLLTQVLPEIVSCSCFYENLSVPEIARHLQGYEDAEHIRQQLVKKGLVAFIATGSILPRESGISPKPLPRAVAFKSPDKITVSLETADGNLVQGLGIPEGVTLIVGGGYHGKSTLLQAVELGVYNQLPGDGRELVITREDAVKIRAEDGGALKR
jgi:predicted ABC-class ATPase